MKLSIEQVTDIIKMFAQQYPGIPVGLWAEGEGGYYVMAVGPSDGNPVQIAAIANLMLARAIVENINKVMLLDMDTPQGEM